MKEERFKKINAKLKHLPNLSFNELKHLYNELHASKEEYLKYMTKLEIRKDKIIKIALFLVLSMDIFLLGWMIIQSVPFIVKLIEAVLIFLVGVDCYQEFITKPCQKVLDKYKDDMAIINDLILKYEKEPEIELKSIFSKEESAKQCFDIIYGKEDKATLIKEPLVEEGRSGEESVTKPKYEYTLSSVFPTPEIEEIAMKVVRDKNKEDLEAEERPFTLKKDLTKEKN